MGANRTGSTRVDMGKFLTTPTARPNNAMGMPQPMEDMDNDTRVITTMNNTTLWRRSHHCCSSIVGFRNEVCHHLCKIITVCLDIVLPFQGQHLCGDVVLCLQLCSEVILLHKTLLGCKALGSPDSNSSKLGGLAWCLDGRTLSHSCNFSIVGSIGLCFTRCSRNISVGRLIVIFLFIIRISIPLSLVVIVVTDCAVLAVTQFWYTCVVIVGSFVFPD